MRDGQDSARHADPRTTRRYDRDRDRDRVNPHATHRLAAVVGSLQPCTARQRDITGWVWLRDPLGGWFAGLLDSGTSANKDRPQSTDGARN